MFSEAAESSSSGNAEGMSPHQSWSEQIRKKTGESSPCLPVPGQILLRHHPEVQSLLPAALSDHLTDQPFEISGSLISPSLLLPCVVPFFVSEKISTFFTCSVIYTFELFSGTDRPVDRTGSDPQFLFNIIQ